MTITVTPKLEKALFEEAQKQGTTPERLALDHLSEFFVPEEQELEAQGEAAEGSAYDLFEGLIGRVGSGGAGTWSENCGEKFAEGMAEKRRQGHL